MEYDKSKKHSRWVAFRFDNQTRLQMGQLVAIILFRTLLDMEYQRTQTDFGRKGYDRGHLCASADRLYKQDANDQTFYYTNMSPQRNNFNTGVWLALEGQVQSWGRSCTASDTLYVVKGGTIDKEEQVKEYIGGDRSKPVPKYYYMALLFKKGDSFKALAFWMEHTDSKPVKNNKTC